MISARYQGNRHVPQHIEHYIANTLFINGVLRIGRPTMICDESTSPAILIVVQQVVWDIYHNAGADVAR